MKCNLQNARYMQYAAALAATLSALATGMTGTWPSPSLAKFQSDDSPIGTKLSDEELSWVVSCYLLASVPGAIVAGWVIDYLGRKPSLLLSILLFFAHWLCLIFANSLTILVVGRVLAGFSMGMIVPATLIYLSEIAEDDIRGKLGTYLILMKTLGAVIVLIVGPYVSYTALGIICACAPVASFAAFILMPESPFYYVKVGKPEEAMKSLVRLSKKSADDKFVEKRLVLIQKTVEEHMQRHKGTFIDLLTKKEYRWALFLLFGIKSLQQFSGHVAIEAYIQPIVGSASSGLEPEIASIIVGCIQIPPVILSGFLVDKIGRKPLLVSSAGICCVALLGEGTYFLVQDYFGKGTSSIGWLPTTGLALFWIMNPIGISTVPYILLGELFPINIKSTAVVLATIYSTSAGFVVSKFFMPLSNEIGIYSAFYIFATICFLGALFVISFLPETKGKDFREIQELLDNRRKRRREGTRNPISVI